MLLRVLVLFVLIFVYVKNDHDTTDITGRKYRISYKKASNNSN